MTTARLLRGLVLVLPLAFGFGLGACGGDDGDDGGGNAGTSGSGGSGGSSGNTGVDPRCRVSACPNHADPYDTEDECDFVLSWDCYDLFRDYADCIQANETCNSSGRSDLVSTSSACDDVSVAFSMCQ